MAGTSKSTATRSTSRRRPAEPRKVKGGRYEFGRKTWKLTIGAGEMFLVAPDDSQWAPAVCGVHRSAGTAEHSTDDVPPSPAGFDPKCEDCQTQAVAAADQALQHRSL